MTVRVTAAYNEVLYKQYGPTLRATAAYVEVLFKEAPKVRVSTTYVEVLWYNWQRLIVPTIGNQNTFGGITLQGQNNLRIQPDNNVIYGQDGTPLTTQSGELLNTNAGTYPPTAAITGQNVFYPVSFNKLNLTLLGWANENAAYGPTLTPNQVLSISTIINQNGFGTAILAPSGLNLTSHLNENTFGEIILGNLVSYLTLEGFQNEHAWGLPTLELLNRDIFVPSIIDPDRFGSITLENVNSAVYVAQQSAEVVVKPLTKAGIVQQSTEVVLKEAIFSSRIGTQNVESVGKDLVVDTRVTNQTLEVITQADGVFDPPRVYNNKSLLMVSAHPADPTFDIPEETRNGLYIAMPGYSVDDWATVPGSQSFYTDQNTDFMMIAGYGVCYTGEQVMLPPSVSSFWPYIEFDRLVDDDTFQTIDIFDLTHKSSTGKLQPEKGYTTFSRFEVRYLGGGDIRGFYIHDKYYDYYTMQVGASSTIAKERIRYIITTMKISA